MRSAKKPFLTGVTGQIAGPRWGFGTFAFSVGMIFLSDLDVNSFTPCGASRLFASGFSAVDRCAAAWPKLCLTRLRYQLCSGAGGAAVTSLP